MTDLAGSATADVSVSIAAASSSPPPPAPQPSECSNGRDDDGDGLIDARDPQCAARRGREAPKDNPILACTGRALTLTDVLPAGRRVRLGGLADPTLAGKTVQLLVGSRVVARTTVRRDGSFATTSAAPKTAGARFAAQIGNLRSTALKLDRKTIDARVTHSAGRITLTATVSARDRSGARIELLLRRACGPYSTAATAKLPRSGRLRIRLPGAATSATATIVVRARIRLSGGRVTYTLPRAITPP